MAHIYDPKDPRWVPPPQSAGRRARRESRAKIQEALPAIIDMQIEAALAGCPKAAKMLLDKGISSLKPVLPPHDPISMDTTRPPAELLQDIFRMHLYGEISQEQSDGFTRIIQVMVACDKHETAAAELESLVEQLKTLVQTKKSYRR